MSIGRSVSTRDMWGLQVPSSAKPAEELRVRPLVSEMDETLSRVRTTAKRQRLHDKVERLNISIRSETLSVPAKSWDEYNRRSAGPLPVSQLPLDAQDGVFEAPAVRSTVLVSAALMAAQGIDSVFFSYSEPDMRLRAAPTRLPGLSAAATRSVLEVFADCGSLVRRLRYTVDRICDLHPHRIAIALASVISRQVDHLVVDIQHLSDVPIQHVAPIMDLLRRVHPAHSAAYMLAKVLGCADLLAPAHLDEIPSANRFLNVAYQELRRVRQQPRLSSLLWHVLRQSLDPWLVQVNRMLGHDTGCFILPASQLMEQLLPDIFVRPNQFALFSCVDQLVPVFMPREYARLAVEALNCSVLLVRHNKSVPRGPQCVWPGALQACGVPVLREPQNEDPFSLGVLDRFRSPLESIRPDLTQPELEYHLENPEVDLLQMLAPVSTANAMLNGALWDMFLDRSSIFYLPHHIWILTQVCLLQNGVLFSELQDPLALMTASGRRPTEGEISELSTLVEDALSAGGVGQAAAHLVSLGLQRDERKLSASITDNITIIYSPPEPINVLITDQVLETCAGLFSHLLRWKQDERAYAEVHDMSKLLGCTEKISLIARTVSSIAKELQDAVTDRLSFDKLCSQFHGITQLGQACLATL